MKVKTGLRDTCRIFQSASQASFARVTLLFLLVRTHSLHICSDHAAPLGQHDESNIGVGFSIADGSADTSALVSDWCAHSQRAKGRRWARKSFERQHVGA